MNPEVASVTMTASRQNSRQRLASTTGGAYGSISPKSGTVPSGTVLETEVVGGVATFYLKGMPEEVGTSTSVYRVTARNGSFKDLTIQVTCLPPKDLKFDPPSGSIDLEVGVPIDVVLTDLLNGPAASSFNTALPPGLVAQWVDGQSVRLTGKAQEDGAYSVTWTVGDGYGGSASFTLSVLVIPQQDFNLVPPSSEETVFNGIPTVVNLSFTKSD